MIFSSHTLLQESGGKKVFLVLRYKHSISVKHQLLSVRSVLSSFSRTDALLNFVPALFSFAEY